MADENRNQEMQEQFEALRKAIAADIAERFEAGERRLREGLSADLDARFEAGEQRLSEKLTKVITDQLETAQRYLDGRMRVQTEELTDRFNKFAEGYGGTLDSIQRELKEFRVEWRHKADDTDRVLANHAAVCAENLFEHWGVTKNLCNPVRTIPLEPLEPLELLEPRVPGSGFWQGHCYSPRMSLRLLVATAVLGMLLSGCASGRYGPDPDTEPPKGPHTLKKLSVAERQQVMERANVWRTIEHLVSRSDQRPESSRGPTHPRARDVHVCLPRQATHRHDAEVPMRPGQRRQGEGEVRREERRGAMRRSRPAVCCGRSASRPT